MAIEQAQNHAVQPQLAQAPAQEHRRLERILKQQRTSLTRGIADAVVIKDGELFFLSNPHGDVPLKGSHGYGLYYHDTRYLNGYALRVAGADWEILSASAARCFESVCQLANPPLRTRDGRFVQKEELGLKWERVVDGKCLMLHDVLTLQNFSDDPIEVPITATFATAFEPMFEVRGLVTKELGQPRPPVWEDGALSFIYEGADHLFRSLTVRFSRPPDRAHGTAAGFHVRVEPRQTAQLRITLEVAESPELHAVQPRAMRPPQAQEVAAVLHRTMEAWLGKETEVASDSILLDRALARSLRDLRMLRMTLRGWHYYAAGIPWFATLFGRDSIIACLQTLAFEPEIAAQTLRLLASFQGQRVDADKDEEPGKIMHELRAGEMAHLNLIPQTPYYGSVDATPLFLILL